MIAASTDPVAGVIVDVPLAHLDRIFDYEIAQAQSEAAQPGVRVRVRLAGRLVDGWLVERRATSDSGRALRSLERVVSPDPVLTRSTLTLARAVADRYAGTLAEVLRSAVPPRHAKAEKDVNELMIEPKANRVGGKDGHPPVAGRRAVGDFSGNPTPGWEQYRGAQDLFEAIAAGLDRHAAWTALPGEDWASRVAELVHACAASGRRALVVLPDARDVARVQAAVGVDNVELRADLAPHRRYDAYLRARRGLTDVVIGTRAAAFAPITDVGLVVLWDDGDDSLADPRAPYWHAREVLFLRVQQQPCVLAVGSFARSADVARAVRTGWLTDLSSDRTVVRARAPRVTASDDEGIDPLERSLRLPKLAFETVRTGLETGPVLVSVPRAGYVPALACANCRRRAACKKCTGPLLISADGAIPSCARCGTAAVSWRCPHCSGADLRAATRGVERTADELSRAFGGVAVLRSGSVLGASRVLTGIRDRPSLVVATPGAEPRAPSGYAAGVLLDGSALLDRPDARADEEAARRWFNALAGLRVGAPVAVVAPASHPVVQALVRWDPAGLADRILDERGAAGLPPATRTAEIVGAPTDVLEVLAALEVPASVRARVLGPLTDAADSARALVTVQTADGLALAGALYAVRVRRSVRKATPVTIRIDPVHLA